MNKTYDIEDHIALVCECGCVRWHILKSGNIECQDCRLQKKILIHKTLDAAAKVARGEYTRPQEDNIVAYTAEDIASAIERLKEGV